MLGHFPGNIDDYHKLVSLLDPVKNQSHFEHNKARILQTSIKFQLPLTPVLITPKSNNA